MKIVQDAVKFINSDQIPVLTCDQPLFAMAKEIQWTWPVELGENRYVVMLGGLHIEITAFKTLGSWLNGSGWVDALTQSMVATAGTADSYLQCSHLTRTRYAHQMTSVALHMLQKDAFEKYTSTVASKNDHHLGFFEWCDKQSQQYPQFLYWSLTLQLEITVLLFTRSVRESNFQLYLESLIKLIPWFFALDRTHYARWASVHIRDMLELSTKHPAVYDQFMKGNFTVKKTTSKFSAMAIDQAHEQNNEMVKGDGGTVGLMQN